MTLLAGWPPRRTTRAGALSFSAAMLLSIVLWEQGAWHWSALRTAQAT